jgi:hypothetical protein
LALQNAIVTGSNEDGVWRTKKFKANKSQDQRGASRAKKLSLTNFLDKKYVGWTNLITPAQRHHDYFATMP